MSNIRNEAEGLDQALKKSTGSARHLAFEITGISGGLGSSVKAASELAEVLAKVSNNARIAASATGIGAVVAGIGTAIALTIGWHEKTKEIENATKAINSNVQQLNASAKNDTRLAQELKIMQQKDKQLEAIEKERGMLGELSETLNRIASKGGVMGTLIKALGINKIIPQHDYTAMRAAINDEANAAVKEYKESVRRKFEEQDSSTLEDISRQVAERISDEAIRGKYMARLDKARADRAVDQNGDYTQEQKDRLHEDLSSLFEEVTRTVEYNVIKPLGDQLGRSFVGSIVDGISSAISSGSIGEGFKALTGGILIGMGNMLIQIGTQSLLAANLLNSIINSLKAFAPAGAIAPSLALIALGGVLVGLGSSLGGGRSGGGHGGYSSSGGGTTIIDRGLINPANGLVTSPGLITKSAQEGDTNIFVIGENDPRAQRTLYNMVNSAKKRIGEV